MKDLRKKRTDRKGRGLWRRCLGFVRPNQFMLWVWVCIRLQSRAAAQLGIGKPCTCVAGSSLVGLGWTRKLWSHPLWLLQVYAASAMSTKSGWPCISVTTISNNLSPNLVAEKEPCGIAHRFLDQEFKLLTAWLSCLFFFPIAEASWGDSTVEVWGHLKACSLMCLLIAIGWWGSLCHLSMRLVGLLHGDWVPRVSFG